MRIKRDFILRSIAGDKLLVPVGETAIQMNGIVVLNDVGARIWELLPQAPDEGAIVEALLGEYQAERPTLEADVAEFLEQLRAMDIVE